MSAREEAKRAPVHSARLILAEQVGTALAEQQLPQRRRRRPERRPGPLSSSCIHGLRRQAGQERRLADHSQLHLPCHVPPLNLSRVADPEAQADAGIGNVEPAQGGGEQVGPRYGARPDDERSTVQPAQVGHGLLGTAEEAQLVEDDKKQLEAMQGQARCQRRNVVIFISTA